MADEEVTAYTADSSARHFDLLAVRFAMSSAWPWWQRTSDWSLQKLIG
ncbi:MAG: hypothetical protein QOG95_1605 [Mycobacterium sp.]|nr:hypothetical protein [Mycobacterium sp.]